MVSKHLKLEEEKSLIRSWQKSRNKEAFDELIDCYKPLVLKIAKRYRYYNGHLVIHDLIQEGMMAMIQAAFRFDLDRGVRFSSYAKWWVLSAIQNYVLKNWSIVKTVSTPTQRNLFFNLKRLQQKIEQLGHHSSQEGINLEIARSLKVSLSDIEKMHYRVRDLSLNTPFSDNTNQDLIDFLQDGAKNPEEQQLQEEKNHLRRLLLQESLQDLSPQEKMIVTRYLSDVVPTLSDMGAKLGLTKERIRQIEYRALRKLGFILKEKSIQRKQQWVLA